MVVRETDRHHETRLDFAILHNGFHDTTAEAKDGNFRLVDDRGEMCATNATLVRDGERAAFHFLEGNFSRAGLLGEFLNVLRKLDEIFLVHVADDGNEESLLG